MSAAKTKKITKTKTKTKIAPPPSSFVRPRYASLNTFALLPYMETGRVDVGVVGIPFDSGCTFRSGARFAPNAIRRSSRLMRAYNPAQSVYPFRDQTVADLGDIACTPFNNAEAVEQIEDEMRQMLRDRIARAPVVLGGDHTVSYPVLRALRAVRTPRRKIALLHFDSHMDTFDEYFGEKVTHGTPFRRAVDEGLIDASQSMHIGVRGSLNRAEEIEQDETLGFSTLRCDEIEERGVPEAVDRILRRVRVGTPCYISVDVDVVDPGAAPGTGTPESGGLSALQLLTIVRSLRKGGLMIVGADVVEVAPPYDLADVTATLAATIAYEFVCLMAPPVIKREKPKKQEISKKKARNTKKTHEIRRKQENKKGGRREKR